MNTSEAAIRARLAQALREHGETIADRWMVLQREQGVLADADISDTELREEADSVVDALKAGLESELPAHRVVSDHTELHQAVVELSMRRANGGASPTATSLSVLTLKEALLETVQDEATAAGELYHTMLLVNRLLDAAGAVSFSTFVDGREEIIRRQSRQLLEVSTPVVQLWRNVLGVPLIGTLDTARTQVVMENLLQEIQKTEALVTIIDITGVPTVDTAVAQHLMHTVNAVRLMGADCFISGIRPQIAQTIAQLGIDLSTILTRATLSDALEAAVRMTDGGARSGATASGVGTGGLAAAAGEATR